MQPNPMFEPISAQVPCIRCGSAQVQAVQIVTMRGRAMMVLGLVLMGLGGLTLCIGIGFLIAPAGFVVFLVGAAERMKHGLAILNHCQACGHRWSG